MEINLDMFVGIDKDRKRTFDFGKFNQFLTDLNLGIKITPGSVGVLPRYEYQNIGIWRCRRGWGVAELKEGRYTNHLYFGEDDLYTDEIGIELVNVFNWIFENKRKYKMTFNLIQKIQECDGLTFIADLDFLSVSQMLGIIEKKVEETSDQQLLQLLSGNLEIYRVLLPGGYKKYDAPGYFILDFCEYVIEANNIGGSAPQWLEERREADKSDQGAPSPSTTIQGFVDMLMQQSTCSGIIFLVGLDMAKSAVFPREMSALVREMNKYNIHEHKIAFVVSGLLDLEIDQLSETSNAKPKKISISISATQL